MTSTPRSPLPAPSGDVELLERLADARGDLLAQVGQRIVGQREVLDGMVAGHPNKVIAFHLSLSPRTVEIHRARVMDKMQARSLSELVRLAITAGIAAA